ncbi:chorismate synthase [Parvularcula maris]|uniref:Chorismate synthase n=1 Tax=Parvularcula maris TaxID=2965077 RepID=A0A9X2RI16_9PROT|nr:chorismate synthase [Parvularcula maris]MCQ8185565.1 chorismate synthase [Parvularcula maris]
MSHNSFGHLFRVTTWGESHGPALGCVIDGCPPLIPFDLARVQDALDRRKPGQSRFVTQRREDDRVKVLSGVFEDDRTDGLVTTGTPISLMIENTDQRSKDYSAIRDTYRPGHADLTYQQKYGIRDYRGGGRSSARETAARVAAGAVAQMVLERLFGQVQIRAGLVSIGRSTTEKRDWAAVSANPFFCPDAEKAKDWEALIDETRKAGDSLGGIVEVEAAGFPPGLGAPVYGKLDQDIASALMSINAAKGVEIGDGMEAGRLKGTENADEMRMVDGQVTYQSNHVGGVLGGISTGAPIVARVAIKPTSSILTPTRSVTKDGADTEVVTKGRHDPCVAIRAVPVVEAMMAIVLADHALRHRGQVGGFGGVGK